MVWTMTVSSLIVPSKPGNKGLGTGWEEEARTDACIDGWVLGR